MKRTILFLEQQSWRGGAQRVLEATLEALDGAYTCVVAFPDRGLFRAGLELGGVETIDLPIGAYSTGRKSALEMVAFAWRSLYCGFKLARFVRRRGVGLIYINGPRCLPAGVLASWLTGLPTVFHLHLILERRPDVLLATHLSRRVSRIVACSRAAAAALLVRDGRLLAKTQVLYNPLRRQSATPVVPVHMGVARGGRVTLGMVGRITESKGHHLLLQAVSRLPSNLRDQIQLLIVGAAAPGCGSDLRYERFLKDEALRLGLAERIHWAGYQSEPGAYYAAMDVLVHPALAEAMGIAILEALDRGVPIIGARTGGIPELVQEGVNGLLVSLHDQNALSEAITTFLSDSAVRDRLRNGARQGVDRRFSMEVFSSGIRATIGELCPPNSTSDTALTAGVGRW